MELYVIISTTHVELITCELNKAKTNDWTAVNPNPQHINTLRNFSPTAAHPKKAIARSNPKNNKDTSTCDAASCKLTEAPLK